AIVGSGKQPFVWVDVDDAVAAIVFLLTHPGLTGPFNIVAPDPVSQAEFAKAFAKAAHKYIPIKMPAFVVKLLFGEMADELLLTGINVQPKKLLAAGFAFHYEKLADSLHHLLK
ncbi:MAG: nucleoside-diphosphate sugar epimerase, partial [Legionellaceae bacterium]|nr:nucleoside-diphosphate sugar epimerase [Legionellaceae bacterium]